MDLNSVRKATVKGEKRMPIGTSISVPRYEWLKKNKVSTQRLIIQAMDELGYKE